MHDNSINIESYAAAKESIERQDTICGTDPATGQLFDSLSEYELAIDKYYLGEGLSSIETVWVYEALLGIADRAFKKLDKYAVLDGMAIRDDGSSIKDAVPIG
jgi:hypothetical protein